MRVVVDGPYDVPIFSMPGLCPTVDEDDDPDGLRWHPRRCKCDLCTWEPPGPTKVAAAPADPEADWWIRLPPSAFWSPAMRMRMREWDR